MKKTKNLRIRKVWVIKPQSRIKGDFKRVKLVKLEMKEMREQTGRREQNNRD